MSQKRRLKQYQGEMESRGDEMRPLFALLGVFILVVIAGVVLFLATLNKETPAEREATLPKEVTHVEETEVVVSSPPAERVNAVVVRPEGVSESAAPTTVVVSPTASGSAATKSAPTVSSAVVEVAVLKKFLFTDGGLETSQNRVIRTQGEWTEFVRGLSAPLPEGVAFDAARQMAVVIFLGERPTAGYGVVVEGVRQVAGVIEVRYRVVSPGEGEVVAQVITRPGVILLLNRTDCPVRFVTEEGHSPL